MFFYIFVKVLTEFIYSSPKFNEHPYKQCLFLYVVLSRAMSPSLGRMVLYSRCSVGPCGTVSLVTRAGCSRCVLCVGCVGEITIRLIGCENGCDSGEGAVVQELTPLSRVCFSGALVHAESVLWVCHLWQWLSSALMWSEVLHWVCWFWGLWEVSLV